MPKHDVHQIDDIMSKQREALAVDISNRYMELKDARMGWEAEVRGLRNYIFATDTTTTDNASLPWKNKTTLPKLTQIRDNIAANYLAALFPNDRWFTWEGSTPEANASEKRRVIEAYMRAKTNHPQFKKTIRKLIYDFIDYGNAYGDAEFVKEEHIDPESEAQIIDFIGPRPVRVSPLNIVFDVTASSFDSTNKYVRTLHTMGSLVKDANSRPEMGFKMDVVDKMRELRKKAQALEGTEDLDIDQALSLDGFGSFSQYLQSGMVELIEAEGDFYDMATGDYFPNHVITIADRSFVIRMEPMKSWLGRSYKKHVGWRERPDNLISMGPMDNLVGMQYRIDHLENLRADIFDQIAHPITFQKGFINDWEFAPGEHIIGHEDSDLDFLRPDATALNADFQIERYETKMEEFAGAPKQAMGFRTPGEKTAFEVSELQQAAGRIFQEKVTLFEEQLLEPLLNSMLELARRNLTGEDIIRAVDEEGFTDFLTVTAEDLRPEGKLRPIGARHFAARSKLVQELTQFYSIFREDPGVISHFSGKRIAQLIEDVLGLENTGFYQDNIRILEDMERQQLVAAAQDQLQMEMTTPEA